MLVRVSNLARQGRESFPSPFPWGGHYSPLENWVPAGSTAREKG